MNDPTQAARTAAVLELLDRSYQAFAAGDKDRADTILTTALETDAVVVSAVQGGMLLGEIPRPQDDYPAWAAYVVSAREHADDLSAP